MNVKGLKINILLKAQLNVKKPEILVNPLANKINPNIFQLSLVYRS